MVGIRTAALVLAAVCLSTAPSLRGQGAPSSQKTDAQLDAEASAAFSLHKQGKLLAALPLYEELHARRPADARYTEGLAEALIAHGGASGSPAVNRADEQRALQLFKQVAAGSHPDDMSQVMVQKLTEALQEPVMIAASAGPRAADGAFARAEVLFNKGDLAGAVEQYTRCWEQYPKFYPAPLYAGDAEYKQDHYDQASVWFERAIAIDPDDGTAHRYWADSLTKQGRGVDARRQYLLAYIGDPYGKAPRLELQADARKQHERWVPPPIGALAEPIVNASDAFALTLDPGKKDASMTAADLAYGTNAAVWRDGKFHKQYPGEKAYRHTLAEEIEGLQAMLEVVHSQKLPEDKLSPTAKSLLLLERDGMLACWVLLDNSDNGVAKDYAAYRAGHRDLLLQYVQKYDLHAM